MSIGEDAFYVIHNRHDILSYKLKYGDSYTGISVQRTYVYNNRLSFNLTSLNNIIEYLKKVL